MRSIQESITLFIDNCLSRENSWEDVLSTTDDLQLVLARSGFAVNGFTFSGRDPPSDLSSDRTSIKVAGMKWHTKADKISLDNGKKSSKYDKGASTIDFHMFNGIVP